MKTYPLLLYGALLGLHVNLGLPLGPGTVPNIIAVPFALALVALQWRRLPSNALPWLGGLLGLFLVSALYAMGFQGAAMESLIAVCLLGYTLVLGLGVFLEISVWSPKRLNRLALTVTIGLIIFGVLEVYTPVQQFAVWFDALYSDRVQNLHRDIVLYGGYRPRMLASEPSRAAIGLSVALSVWVFTTGRWTPKRLALFAIILVGGLLIVRSPFMIVPALLFGARLVLWPQIGSIGGRGNIALEAGRLALVLAGGVATVTLLSLILGSVFESRIAQFDARPDWSVTVRTYGAAQAGWNAAVARPVFGAGVNNFEAAPEIATTFRSLGVPSYVTDTDVLEVSVANGIAVALVFFGFGGTILFLWAWEGLMRSLCPAAPWTIRWVVFIGVSAGYSEIYSPAFVWTIFVLLGGMAVAAKPAQLVHPDAARPGHFTRRPLAGLNQGSYWNLREP